MKLPIVPGNDLNKIETTGFYKGSNLKNAPVKSDVTVCHIPSTDYSEQVISANGVFYRRIKLFNGTWQEWERK
jgi:hypothetical protein